MDETTTLSTTDELTAADYADLTEGDRVAVDYKSAYADRDADARTVAATVARVDEGLLNLDDYARYTVYLVTDDRDTHESAEYYDQPDADRRLDVYCQGGEIVTADLEGRNGGRWHSLTRTRVGPSARVYAQDADDETETDGGQRVATDGGQDLRGSYDRMSYDARSDGFAEGDRVVLTYESPFSGTTVEVEGTATKVGPTSFHLDLDDGRTWGVFGAGIRTATRSRRASGEVDPKNGRTVGYVQEIRVYADTPEVATDGGQDRDANADGADPAEVLAEGDDAVIEGVDHAGEFRAIRVTVDSTNDAGVVRFTTDDGTTGYYQRDSGKNGEAYSDDVSFTIRVHAFRRVETDGGQDAANARRARAALLERDDVTDVTKRNLRNVDAAANPQAILAFAAAAGVDAETVAGDDGDACPRCLSGDLKHGAVPDPTRPMSTADYGCRRCGLLWNDGQAEGVGQ